MNAKTLTFLALPALLALGCDEPDPVEPEAIEQAATPREPEPAAAEQAPVELAKIGTASKATYEMRLWADAPDEIDPGPDTVVLEYVNFPGYYERFDAGLVKDCVLAYEKKPFAMTVYRYEVADEDSYERVVALEACPDLDEKQLAAEWAEAERLREAMEKPEAADPTKNTLGWAGRGFYKTDGADEGRSPADEKWQTFCGAASGVACDVALTAPHPTPAENGAD